MSTISYKVNMDTFECIKTRRSVRNYSNQVIEPEIINKLIEAAIWAPSGKNGQPWKFSIITDKDKINAISSLSIYGKWMRRAPCFIFVFLDKNSSYDYIKDVQSCGAAIQNMLLVAHSLDLGACWVGELSINADQIKHILNIHDQFELMAVITIGYSQGRTTIVGRQELSSFIF